MRLLPRATLHSDSEHVWYGMLGMLLARHNVAGMHSAWYAMPYKTADNETADTQNGIKHNGDAQNGRWHKNGRRTKRQKAQNDRNSKLQKAQNGT